MAVAASATVSVPSGGSGSAFLGDLTVRVAQSHAVGGMQVTGMEPCTCARVGSITGTWVIHRDAYPPPGAQQIGYSGTPPPEPVPAIDISRSLSGSARGDSGCIPSVMTICSASPSVTVSDQVALEDGRVVRLSGSVASQTGGQTVPFTLTLLSGIDASDISDLAPSLVQITGIPSATILEYAQQIADEFNAAGLQLSQLGAPGAATIIIPTVLSVFPATATELKAARALYASAAGIPEEYLTDAVLDALAAWMRANKVSKPQALSGPALEKLAELAAGETAGPVPAAGVSGKLLSITRTSQLWGQEGVYVDVLVDGASAGTEQFPIGVTASEILAAHPDTTHVASRQLMYNNWVSADDLASAIAAQLGLVPGTPASDMRTLFGPVPERPPDFPAPGVFTARAGCEGFGYVWAGVQGSPEGACFMDAEAVSVAFGSSRTAEEAFARARAPPVDQPLEEDTLPATSEVDIIAQVVLASSPQIADAIGATRAEVVSNAEVIASRLAAEGYTAMDLRTDVSATTRVYQVAAEVVSGGGGLPVVPIAIGLAGAGVLAMVLMRRRRR